MDLAFFELRNWWYLQCISGFLILVYFLSFMIIFIFTRDKWPLQQEWTFMLLTFKIFSFSRIVLCFLSAPLVWLCLRVSKFMAVCYRLPCRAPAVCIPEASLLLLLQLLSRDEASADWTNGDQWRRTNQGGGRRRRSIKGGGEKQ